MWNKYSTTGTPLIAILWEVCMIIFFLIFVLPERWCQELQEDIIESFQLDKTLRIIKS